MNGRVAVDRGSLTTPRARAPRTRDLFCTFIEAGGARWTRAVRGSQAAQSLKRFLFVLGVGGG